jgi:hypothetical protein
MMKSSFKHVEKEKRNLEGIPVVVLEITQIDKLILVEGNT